MRCVSDGASAVIAAGRFEKIRRFGGQKGNELVR